MNEQRERQQEIVGTSIAVGAGAGVALGLVLMNVVGNPGFFALGIAVGVSIGTAVGAALSRRER